MHCKYHHSLRLASIALLFSVSACSIPGLDKIGLTGEDGLIRDRVGDYREAPILPQMDIPSDLDSYTIDQLYVIPQVVEVAADTQPFDDVPMPKPIETRRREGVIIQNLGDSRWILLDATPAQVWPLVRDFWSRLNVVLDYENPSSGIAETAWVEVNSEPLLRHKYRISIEPGLHSGYAEIYVTHMSDLRTDPIPLVLNWPEQSDSEDRERQILDALSQYLADRNDVYQASSSSLLAGSIESARKANLIDVGSENEKLALRINYGRAWVQVRQAIERAEIEIVDANRDQSVISVKFSGIKDDTDKPGFFGRLLGRGRGQDAALLQEFAVRLLDTGDTIDVVIEKLGEEKSPQSRLTTELLQEINENLI
jgi:outer membrane protein assembly factor BamC